MWSKLIGQQHNSLLIYIDKGGRKVDNIESQPEWFTHGPISQLDTIELKGFDDDEKSKTSWNLSVFKNLFIVINKIKTYKNLFIVINKI